MKWFTSKKKEAKKLANELSQLDEAKEYLETEFRRIKECKDSWCAETLANRYENARWLYLSENEYRYTALLQLYVAARSKYLSLLDQEQKVQQLKSSVLLRAKFRKPSIRIV